MEAVENRSRRLPRRSIRASCLQAARISGQPAVDGRHVLEKAGACTAPNAVEKSLAARYTAAIKLVFPIWEPLERRWLNPLSPKSLEPAWQGEIRILPRSPNAICPTWPGQSYGFGH
jgi:hypothetical protein